MTIQDLLTMTDSELTELVEVEKEELLFDIYLALERLPVQWLN